MVRTHPETGEKVLFVNGFTTHFVELPHPGECALRPATTRPGAGNLLSYLISQASIPEYQVRWRWKPKTASRSGTTASTQHYAVQDYWPARPEDGTGRHRRRPAVLTKPPITNPLTTS